MISLSQLIQQFDHQQAMSIPADWLQGRTVYGGLTAALALQSVLWGIDNLPPLKSAAFAFVGPAAPSLTFQARCLRAGKSVTSVAVECNSTLGPALNATMIFGQDRPSDVHYNPAIAPHVPPVAACDLWPLEATPDFLRHFEVRMAGKAFPLSQSADPDFMVWIRHQDASGVDPMVALVALADGLPPAAMNFFKTPAPISTITWNFDILEPVPEGGWFLLRSRAEQARDGYSTQTMEVWTESGQRLLWGRQNVAIFI